MSENKVCPSCGETEGHGRYDLMWGCDRRFVPGVIVKRNSRGDMRDYREDLARFPNDPEALVDGPTALRKLKDKRKREGWELKKIDKGSRPKPKPAGQLLREAYQEARRKGFRGEK